MGLKDKIPVVTLPIPTASPALLHATHFLFLLLTLLFLILPSFSGPATGYWWVLITLPIPGSTLGSVWDLGGFGGCKVGEMCEGKGGENVPIMAGQVMSTLMYHFAVGGMFLIMALAEYGLIYKPGPRPICAGWTATYLLIAAPVVVSTAMIVDLIVRSKMIKNDSIESVQTGIVFWLSPAALGMSMLWALTIFRFRVVRYRATGKELVAQEEKAERQRRAKTQGAEGQGERRIRPGGLRGLWPW